MTQKMNQKITGVITPILTPFNDDLSFAADLYVRHAHWLLQQGIHYIAPFGTTGEALSLSVSERMSALDALIDGGIDAGVLMPGTGLCNLDDTVALCRHAVQRGCLAVLTLPPFFYKNASDDGLYAHFVRLIEAVNDCRLKICMYHIPPLAGIGFSPELAHRLARDFPAVIVAYKDSSRDFENTKAVIAAAPNIAVFPGSEIFLRPGLEHGGMGCIAATSNVNPAGIRHIFDLATAAKEGDIERAIATMMVVRKPITDYAPIAAMKGVLAKQYDDRRWANVRPPLLPLGDAEIQTLINALASVGAYPLG